MTDDSQAARAPGLDEASSRGAEPVQGAARWLAGASIGENSGFQGPGLRSESRARTRQVFGRSASSIMPKWNRYPELMRPPSALGPCGQ